MIFYDVQNYGAALQAYAQYESLAKRETNVVLGGRLGEHKYYDIDQVIAAAMRKVKYVEKTN